MSAVFIGLALFAANGGGLLAMIAYATVVAAFSLGSAGPITALRETSVVFAVLIGWLFLGETPASHSRLHHCCGGRYPARALIVLTSFARMLLKAEAC